MDMALELLFQKTSVAYAILELHCNDHASPKDYVINYANDSFVALFPNGIQNNKLVLNTEEDFNQIIQTSIDLMQYQSVAKFNQYSDIYAKLFLFEITLLNQTHIALRAKDITKSFLREDEGDVFYRVNVDMLCVTNKAGYYLSVSQDLLAALGYEHSEMIGKKGLDFIHQDDIKDTKETMLEIRNSKTTVQFKNRIRCKNHSYRYMEWRAKLQGKYVYASVRDITEMVETQQQLERVNESLKQHAFEIEKANRDLEILSTIDALTGVYNRYYINNRLNEESQRMLRYHYPLSLIFFDLDHFKNINDTYGHLVGDDILKATVAIVRDNIRESDILGRWGGEEFLIIAPHTTQEEALLVAEKLRQLIADYEHPMVGKITCSFGVVQRYANETLKEVYERVDDALYHAKNDGRNRVYTSTFAEKKTFDSVYLEWNEYLHCGNRVIDRQHERIMKLGNDLIAMILSSEDDIRIRERTIEFLDFVKFHFKSEEKILKEMDYPHLLSHQLEHARLLKKGADYLTNHTLQKSPSAFFSFIVDDIVFGHLMEDDYLFYPYFQKTEESTTSHQSE